MRPVKIVLSLLLLLALPATAQIEVVIGENPDRLRGAHANGELLLFTPDPNQAGSSLSHWDTSAEPNLLMEPSINSDLAFLDLDVTDELMEDIGWDEGTSSISIINLDPQGTGFTDPRAFGGAPGNPATTLGEARINLFNAVFAAWDLRLQSNVEIEIAVTWTPLFCDGSSAALAGAFSPSAFEADSFPKSETWYQAALAEALNGTNLPGDPDWMNADIVILMNSDIDNSCLLPGGYYYGLDGNNSASEIDVAPTILHEISHGLGFASYTDDGTGQFGSDTASGVSFPTIYDHFVFDTDAGRTWARMQNDTDRLESAVNFRKVTWNGKAVTAAVDDLLTPGALEMQVTAPAELAGSYEVGTANFGPALPDGGLSGELVCLADGNGEPFDGCSAAVNSADIAGKIALIDRGECSFIEKVLNAQAAGAIGAVIANNDSNAPVGLGGTDDGSVVIPAVSVGRAAGQAFRTVACPSDDVVIDDGRFTLEVAWESATDKGEGVGTVLTDNSAFFYFFGPKNPEIFVKVLNGCNNNGNYWVFAAGLTNVKVTLTVTDNESGQVKTYVNPLGSTFEAIQDTGAFATCP